MLYNYVLRKEYLLSKIPRKYARVHKIIKFYQNIRIGYIIFEAIFFLIFLISLLIIVSYGLVYFYLQNK